MSERWTAAEDAVLRAEYHRRTANQIGQAIGRSAAAVKGRARKLGIDASTRTGKKEQYQRWSRQEDEYLIEGYATKTANVLAKELGRTPQAVHNRARKKLGLRANRTRGRLWTEDDDKKLWWMWSQFSPALIAKKLGRTQTACKERAKQLGMGGAQQATKSVKTIAKETGYSEERVRSAAKYLDIRIKSGWRTDRETKERKYRKAYRHSAITEEQEEAILKFLAVYPDGQNIVDTRWGRNGRPDACLECQSTDRKHKSKGLCGACYARKRRT